MEAADIATLCETNWLIYNDLTFSHLFNGHLWMALLVDEQTTIK